MTFVYKTKIKNCDSRIKRDGHLEKNIYIYIKDIEGKRIGDWRKKILKETPWRSVGTFV